VGNWISFCCTVVYKWVIVVDGIKFESNDISLYTKTILSGDGLLTFSENFKSTVICFRDTPK